MRAEHDDVDEVVGRGVIPILHDQQLVLDETRLSAEYGVSGGFALGLMLPFRVVGTTIVYRDAATREPVMLVHPNIHHRDETLTGFGDPWLYAHLAFARGRLTLDARFGVSLPLGRTEPDPFRLGDLGLPHEHIQFGTGTVVPLLGIELHRQLRGFRLGGWAWAQPSLYADAQGYQASDRYSAGVAADSALGTATWNFQLGFDVLGETAERWQGQVQADEGNRGRLDLLVDTGAGVQLSRTVRFYASLKIPVYTWLAGGQLQIPLYGVLGVSGFFDLAPARDPHHHHHHDEADGGHEDHDDHQQEDHEHEAQPVGPPADWRGLDVADATVSGAAVELAPVAGKVTVYDFWAPWCVPCKELDRDLASLARRAPARLSVRKVNIVDWDSPAAARYLIPAGFDLPHLTAFGADGRRAFDRSGSPAELARAVEELLDP